MKDVLAFFQKIGVYYLATVDDNKPSIRPVGLPMEVNGKFSFCLAKYKDVFKQIEKNNQVAICCVGVGGGWMRLSGRISLINDPKIYEKWLDAGKHLIKMYEGKYDLMSPFSFDSFIAEYKAGHGETPEFVTDWELSTDILGNKSYKKQF